MNTLENILGKITSKEDLAKIELDVQDMLEKARNKLACEESDAEFKKFCEQVDIIDCNGALSFRYRGYEFRIEESFDVQETLIESEQVYRHRRSDMMLLWWSPTEEQLAQEDVTPVGQMIEWMCGATFLEEDMDKYNSGKSPESELTLKGHIYDFKYAMDTWIDNRGMSQKKKYKLLLNLVRKVDRTIRALYNNDIETAMAEGCCSIYAGDTDILEDTEELPE